MWIYTKPFIKWVGGKAQLLPQIRQFYPFDENINKYIEPFVGGGAVLFDILNSHQIKEIYISDKNEKLINTYRVVRDDVDELIKRLSHYHSEYQPLSPNDRKAYYNLKRENFNSLSNPFSSHETVEVAALMIFLNKTCFNGLYRVNKSGKFNVPHGKYTNPLICDEENLRNCSRALKNIRILCTDYTNMKHFIDEHTFIYVDPPYRPLSQTSSFTSYTKDVFGDREQIELKLFLDEVDERGGKFLLSNSDPKNVNPEDNFFDDLYKGYNIYRVPAKRSINSNGNGRQAISELLISNTDNTL